MSKSSWLRLGIALAGVGSIVAGFLVPPAALPLIGLGTGLLGYAKKSPGTLTAGQIGAHGEQVAEAVGQATLQAVQSAVGKPAGQVAQLAGKAAAAAAAQAVSRIGR